MAAEPLPLQGMSDVAAPEVCLWQHLESAARRVFSLYDLDEGAGLVDLIEHEVLRK